MSGSRPGARLVADLKAAGISHPAVLTAIGATPRELFVPETFRARAYDDVALPIGREQTISQPSVVARMTAALEPRWGLTVLEVGTGSGYHAAILSRVFRRVYSIERRRSLLREAEGRLKALGIVNVATRAGDGSLGWPEAAPFPRILLTAAAEDVPRVLLAQLAPDGVMVLPVGPPDDQRLVRVRNEPDGPETEDLGPIRFVPLVEGLAEE